MRQGRQGVHWQGRTSLLGRMRVGKLWKSLKSISFSIHCAAEWRISLPYNSLIYIFSVLVLFKREKSHWQALYRHVLFASIANEVPFPTIELIRPQLLWLLVLLLRHGCPFLYSSAAWSFYTTVSRWSKKLWTFRLVCHSFHAFFVTLWKKKRLAPLPPRSPMTLNEKSDPEQQNLARFFTPFFVNPFSRWQMHDMIFSNVELPPFEKNPLMTLFEQCPFSWASRPLACLCSDMYMVGLLYSGADQILEAFLRNPEKCLRSLACFSSQKVQSFDGVTRQWTRRGGRGLSI